MPRLRRLRIPGTIVRQDMAEPHFALVPGAQPNRALAWCHQWRQLVPRRGDAVLLSDAPNRSLDSLGPRHNHRLRSDWNCLGLAIRSMVLNGPKGCKSDLRLVEGSNAGARDVGRIRWRPPAGSIHS